MILEGRSFSISSSAPPPRPEGWSARADLTCIVLFSFPLSGAAAAGGGRVKRIATSSFWHLAFRHQRRPYGLRIGRSCEFGLCCFAFLLSPSATPHGTGRLVRSRRSRPASFEDLGKCPAGRVRERPAGSWVPAALQARRSLLTFFRCRKKVSLGSGVKLPTQFIPGVPGGDPPGSVYWQPKPS